MQQNVNEFLKENGINPDEVEIKGAAIAKKLLSTHGSFVNYASMVKEDELYPVIYTVSQDGTKVFKPQYLLGKYLSEGQIKYLYEVGYFNI